MRLLLMTLFLLNYYVVFSQNSVIKIDARLNNNFRGFEIFDKELKSADIVLLGEGLHNYPIDTYSKLKIIKYLHNKLNFNIILFEESFQDFWHFNTVMNQNQYPICEIVNYCLNKPLSKGMVDIFAYINSLKNEKDTIIVGGFDIWTNYTNSINHFLNFIPENESTYIRSQALKDSYKYLISLKPENQFDNSKIIYYLDSMSMNKEFFTDTLLNEIWLQMYVNFRASLFYDSKYSSMNYPIFISKNRKTNMNSIDNYRYRDSIMALNVEFYKKLYPNEKIIILASSVHVRKSTMPFEKKKIIGNNTVSLGERLSNKYENTYHIAWIYPQIKFGNKRKYRNRKSLESHLKKSQIGSCIIPLKNFTFNNDTNFIAYPIWNFKTKGVWKSAYDAFIYYDTICSYSGRNYKHELPTQMEWKFYFAE